MVNVDDLVPQLTLNQLMANLNSVSIYGNGNIGNNWSNISAHRFPQKRDFLIIHYKTRTGFSPELDLHFFFLKKKLFLKRK